MNQLAQKMFKDEHREAYAPLKLISASAEDEVKLRGNWIFPLQTWIVEDAKDERFHQEFAMRLLMEQTPGQEEVEKNTKAIILYDIGI